jgi:hypothetical protein
MAGTSLVFFCLVLLWRFCVPPHTQPNAVRLTYTRAEWRYRLAKIFLALFLSSYGILGLSVWTVLWVCVGDLLRRCSSAIPSSQVNHHFAELYSSTTVQFYLVFFAVLT